MSGAERQTSSHPNPLPKGEGTGEDRSPVNWRSERDIDVMTFLASLAGERLFFDGDHSTGVAGDMRGATSITTQMLAYYAMGDTIAARSVNLASMRGAQPMETGADRGLFDTDFGKQVEDTLAGFLVEVSCRLVGQDEPGPVGQGTRD